MISRIPSSPYSKLLSKLNSAPFAASAAANPSTPRARRRQGLSQGDMAYDILRKARAPLHISELLARIRSTFHVTVDRESLVSSLTKKVARGDRFIRTDKNTFGLRPEVP